MKIKKDEDLESIIDCSKRAYKATGDYGYMKRLLIFIRKIINIRKEREE